MSADWTRVPFSCRVAGLRGPVTPTELRDQPRWIITRYYRKQKLLMETVHRNTFPFKSNITRHEPIHPAGHIILTNGKDLECYPKPDPPSVIREDGLALDTTGEFLRARDAQPAKGTGGGNAPEPWRETFFKHAFFLYAHREDILSDSRMFLTPLPFGNNLAYCGTSGLRYATLGVYLEWWEACGQSVLRDRHGEIRALTYFIAGSPLSGNNRCSAVTRNGKTVQVVFRPFLDIWSSFSQINTRYTEAKQLYRAFSLEETIAELNGSGEGGKG